MAERKPIDWHSRKMRIFVGISVPIVTVVLAILASMALSMLEQGPPCWFYKITGLYCPGCGTGRAAMALLDGDILLAFRNQPLMMILVPIMLYYLLKVYIAYVFGKDVLPFFKIGVKLAIGLLAVILLYWVLRNISVPPFSYLAPVANN